MRNSRLFSFVALLACAAIWILPAPLARGQSAVTWGTPTFITGDSDVSLTGTRLWAYNFGDGAASPVVNGVTFTGLASATGNADLTFTTVGSSIYQSSSAFKSTQSFYTSLSAGYQTLLQSATYWSGNIYNTQTLTLNNLMPGATYQLQLWVNDSRAFHAGLSVSFADSFNNSVALLYNNNGNSLGQFVAGTFVAASTTQSFALGPYSPQLNAATLSLTAIPEPATAALGAGVVATLALALRSRRRQAI